VALVTVVLLARLQRQAPETLGASEPPAEAPA
jgi:hypothetical protein